MNDVFSRKIIGYNIAENHISVETIKALKMAFVDVDGTSFLCHHSDSGLQYWYNEYI